MSTGETANTPREPPPPVDQTGRKGDVSNAVWLALITASSDHYRTPNGKLPVWIECEGTREAPILTPWRGEAWDAMATMVHDTAAMAYRGDDLPPGWRDAQGKVKDLLDLAAWAEKALEQIGYTVRWRRFDMPYGPPRSLAQPPAQSGT